MKIWCLAGLAGFLLAGPVAAQTTVVERSEFGAVPEYRAPILAWARGFFADPHGLRDTAVSEPVPARDGAGTLVWLVCVQANARRPGGDYLGPRRFAFGFTKAGPLSAPLQRTGSRVASEDCDRLPLNWLPFPALERL